jgi:hypothetical protein
MLQPYLGGVRGWLLHSQNGDKGSPLRLLKLQSSIVGVKTLCIEAFFITLENYRSVDVENGLAWAIWTFEAQVMTKRKGRESNWQFDSRPLKVGNRPDPGVCRWSATHRWKALDEGYNFGLDLIAIRGLHRKLCTLKVVGVPIVGISGVLGQKAIWIWPCGELQRILYGRRWWLPLSSGRGESCESKVACGLS